MPLFLFSFDFVSFIENFGNPFFSLSFLSLLFTFFLHDPVFPSIYLFFFLYPPIKFIFLFPSILFSFLLRKSTFLSVSLRFFYFLSPLMKVFLVFLPFLYHLSHTTKNFFCFLSFSPSQTIITLFFFLSPLTKISLLFFLPSPQSKLSFHVPVFFFFPSFLH